MRKKLPIGIDGFEKIRTNDFYYIDKTMFIQELLHDWGEVNLITRPGRFGKTLNMSMLKCFFEIGSDPALFDGLRILEETELCRNYMGKFPVISISLKSVDGRSFESAFAALQTVIGDEAMRFQFLLESDRLSAREKDSYERLIHIGTATRSIYDMAEDVVTASLRTLSQLLSRHFGQKVILLIDEYDVPLDRAFQAGYYDEMTALIRNVLGNALKTNDSLYFAVLTGCLRISKESIFTGLNNLNVMTVSDPYFCSSFGFTENEVAELLHDYGLEDFQDTVRDWYDGYQFGDVSVYCPWDVLKYAQILIKDRDAQPENYWANTSGNDLIRRLLKRANQTTRSDIERLIHGEAITKPLRQELTYRDVEDSIDNIWSVLYSTGYLTGRGRLPGRQMKLALPNREVQELFVELVKDWFEETTLADTARIQRFCAAFSSGDAAAIQDMLHDYLWESISVRDAAVRKSMKENFYHGMLLGLLRSQGSWLVKSNAETGEGYSDISIRTPERIGIVIELKYAENGNLESACSEALRQIDAKKYTEDLRRHSMNKILTYGIAFHGKDCMVRMG